eukprot:TRINITY_DN4790_c0_g1_i1.p2 TRINITY_DN4790_c0_g1~~TRINITY_DN4790_c0_g1_i1.p2  ORF type:complete len:164 (-),score=22.49 TRINITY_DN4790_c0_g1_i1:134-625(-)
MGGFPSAIRCARRSSIIRSFSKEFTEKVVLENVAMKTRSAQFHADSNARIQDLVSMMTGTHLTIQPKTALPLPIVRRADEYEEEIIDLKGQLVEKEKEITDLLRSFRTKDAELHETKTDHQLLLKENDELKRENEKLKQQLETKNATQDKHNSKNGDDKPKPK